MRCLPLNIYKEVYTFGTSILVCWFCKDTVKFHSINDQPSEVHINSKNGVIMKRWNRYGSFFRENYKPHTIDYYKDGSLKGMYFNSSTYLISAVHPDYRDDWARIYGNGI